MSSLIIPAKRGEKFVVLIKKDNWWIIKSLKQLDGKVTKVRRKTSFYLRAASKWNSTQGWAQQQQQRKLYSSTPTFEKKQITQKVLCGVLGENSPELFLQEMTATVKLCTQPFWGYEIWLAWACFIMLHWIFYLIDSRAAAGRKTLKHS